MPITSLESLRRNSIVLMERYPPPPPSPPKASHIGAPSKRKTHPTCQRRRKLLGGPAPYLPSTDAYLRHEFRAATKGSCASDVASAGSLSPKSISLPPTQPLLPFNGPGNDLDVTDITEFRIGDRVRVRRSCGTTPPSWMEWQSGNVTRISASRTTGPSYRVQIDHSNPRRRTVETFSPHLGEIFLDKYRGVKSLKSIKHRPPVVYARIPSSVKIEDTWTAVEVLEHESGSSPGFRVRSKMGPKKGKAALPCRLQSQNVLVADGKLSCDFKEVEIKPISREETPPRPKYPPLPPPAVLASYRPASDEELAARCKWILYSS